MIPAPGGFSNFMQGGFEGKNRLPDVWLGCWLLFWVISLVRSRGDISSHDQKELISASMAAVTSERPTCSGWWARNGATWSFFAIFSKVSCLWNSVPLIAAFFLVNLVLGSVIAAIACVLGHDYPIWLGFKGGKGIATLAGAVLVLFPPLVFVSFGVIWIAVFLIGRYTSLASISAAVALPISVPLIVAKTETDFLLLVCFSVLMGALAIWRHRSNIARLLNGTENRFGRK
jgi:acyl-phosphate glycerol 3-phosphate acyltransferase